MKATFLTLTLAATLLAGTIRGLAAQPEAGLSIQIERGLTGKETAVLQWTGDYGLYSSRSLNAPARWQRVELDALVAADGRRLLRQPASLDQEFFQLRPNPRPARLATGLYVDALAPREIGLEEEAPLLRITGQGFQDTAMVRLTYPGPKELAMMLRPETVQSRLIEVRIEQSWLEQLSAALAGRDVRGPSAPGMPRHFFVQVIHGNGGRSDLCVMRVKDFDIRINRTRLEQPLVLNDWARSGPSNVLDVTVERRAMLEDVLVEVSAFEAPPLFQRGGQPQRLRLARIPGIGGHAVLPAGDTRLRVPLELTRSVRPGRYVLQTTLRAAGGGAARAILGIASTEACVVEAANGNFPPSPAQGLQFDGFQNGQTSLDLMWQYPVYADGYALERRTGRQTWSSVAVFPGGYVNGWIRHTDTGLQPDTEYCYRIRAWNIHGETLSSPAEVCGATAGLLTSGCYPSDCPPSPWIKFQMKGRNQTMIALKWEYPLDADGYALERKESGQTAWTTVHTFPGGYVAGWIEHTDTGLTPCTEYNYRIRAWNENGETLGKVIPGHTNPWGPDEDWKLFARTAGAMNPPDLEVTLNQAPTWNGNAYSGALEFVWRFRDNADCENAYKIYVQSPEDTSFNQISGWSMLNGGWTDLFSYFAGKPFVFGLWRFKARANTFDIPISNVDQYVAESAIVEILVPDPRPPEDPPPDPPSETLADLGFGTSIGLDWNGDPMTWPEPGESLVAYWTVGNYGNADAGLFRDASVVNNQETYFSEEGSLESGESYTEWLSLPDGLPEGQHLIEAFLDADNDIEEVTKLNNYNYHSFIVGW
jgi:hypothetical protein